MKQEYRRPAPQEKVKASRATSTIGKWRLWGQTRYLRGHSDKSRFSHDLNLPSKQSRNGRRAIALEVSDLSPLAWAVVHCLSRHTVSAAVQAGSSLAVSAAPKTCSAQILLQYIRAEWSQAFWHRTSIRALQYHPRRYIFQGCGQE